jgi:hypothetical protein
LGVAPKRTFRTARKAAMQDASLGGQDAHPTRKEIAWRATKTNSQRTVLPGSFDAFFSNTDTMGVVLPSRISFHLDRVAVI